jgi:hypothetical protein
MRNRMMTFGLSLAAALVTVPGVYAQRWEFGGGGGGSFYNSQTISGPRGSADAGFNGGFAGTAYLGQAGNRFGGEVRYTYLKNDMKLTGSGTNFTFSGQSQAIHYDFLVYMTKSGAKARPYFSVGGGVKGYQGTGPDMAVQPVGSIAVLTRTTQWKPMVTFGGGVRFQVGEHVVLRTDLKVYTTQVPEDVITPVNGSKVSGWYFNFVPLVSLAYTW